MQPRPRAKVLHRGEQRVIAILVKREVDGILLELYPERTELSDAPDRLFRGRVGVSDRSRSHEPGEAIGVPRDHLCHLVVVPADNLPGRQPRRGQRAENEHPRNRRQYLTVIAVLVNHAKPELNVVQRPLSQQKRARPALAQRLKLLDVCPGDLRPTLDGRATLPQRYNTSSD